jgi:hypothetical protein
VSGANIVGITGMRELVAVTLPPLVSTTKIAGASAVKSFALTEQAVAYIKSDGTVAASGAPQYGGRLEDSIKNAVEILSIARADQASLDDALLGQFFVLRVDGSVWTWNVQGRATLVASSVQAWAKNDGALFLLRQFGESTGGRVLAFGNPAFGTQAISAESGPSTGLLDFPFELQAQAHGLLALGLKQVGGVPVAAVMASGWTGTQNHIRVEQVSARSGVPGRQKGKWWVLLTSGVALDLSE